MKRIFLVFVALALLVAAAGCSQTAAVQTATAADGVTQTQTQATPVSIQTVLGQSAATPAPSQTGLGQTAGALAQTSSEKIGTYKNIVQEQPANTATAASAPTTFIGYGYNVLTDSYIHMEGFHRTNPIFKADEVKKRLQRSDAPAQSSNTMMGETLKIYTTSFSSEMEIKSDYPLFTGKISTEFDETSTTKTNTHFIKSLSVYPVYQEYILNSSDLKTILDTTFADDLNGTMSPKELFDKYGTHVVIEDLMGARCEFNYTYSSTESESTASIKGKVDATYKWASGSGSVDDEKTAKSFLSSSYFTSELYGGEKINATTVDDLAKNMNGWIKSINESNSNICRVSNTDSLKPIWTLAIDPKRAKALSDYYDAEGGDVAKNIDSLSNDYIESIRILSDKKKSNAQDQLYNGYTLIDKDLNKGARGDYIYLSYSTTHDPSKAITDMKISFGKQYSFPGDYTKLNNDLNKGAGGDFIYLWTSTNSSRGKPIRAIDVFYGKNANMPVGFTAVDYNSTGSAADLNHNAGGQYIYIGISR